MYLWGVFGPRYVLAIAILSSLYTGLQVFRQVHELSTGKEVFSSRQNAAMLDFFGDQVGFLSFFYIEINSTSNFCLKCIMLEQRSLLKANHFNPPLYSNFQTIHIIYFCFGSHDFLSQYGKLICFLSLIILGGILAFDNSGGFVEILPVSALILPSQIK